MKVKTRNIGAKWLETGGRGLNGNGFRNGLGTRGIGGYTISLILLCKNVTLGS